jgi:PAS domain-containing protein
MESFEVSDESLDKEEVPSALELVNQKLEKAIEQLRLANEGLKTASYGVAVLNNQLEWMHEELESLSRQVVHLRAGYTQALDHMPFPAVLTDREGKVEAWNTAAQQIFHLAVDASVGIDLSEFPVQPSLGQVLSRKLRAVVEGGTTPLRNQLVHVKRTVHRMDVHFTSLSRRSTHGVLVMFVSSPARDGVVPLWERSGKELVNSAAS